ncbi:hypothetical protein [Candidatus Mycalebacterium sp.]
MAIREDSRIEKQFKVPNLKTRNGFRQFLVNQWMKESFGKKYRYFVEDLSNGKRIYLERPARLNKGCDFVIFIEDLFLYKNGNDKPPSHKDLFADLKRKKKFLSSGDWKELIRAIEKVYKTTSCNVSLNCVGRINKNSPMTLEQILYLCKWFFLEQDVTYWSYNGRDMLFEKIQSI